MKYFSWWQDDYYCFGLTFLITLALAPRMTHGIHSIVIMWINFLPVVCMLWNTAKGLPVKPLLKIFGWSVAFYALFHPHHYWEIGEFSKAQGVEFWPVTLLSFIIITLFTFFEMRDNAAKT